MGVYIIVVTIGQSVNMIEVRGLASPPWSLSILQIETFDQLFLTSNRDAVFNVFFDSEYPSFHHVTRMLGSIASRLASPTIGYRTSREKMYKSSMLGTAALFWQGEKNSVKKMGFFLQKSCLKLTELPRKHVSRERKRGVQEHIENQTDTPM